MIFDLSTSNKDLQTPAVKYGSEKRASSVGKACRGCELALYVAVRSRAATDMSRSHCPSRTTFPPITGRRRQSTLAVDLTPLATSMVLGKIYSARIQPDLCESHG